MGTVKTDNVTNNIEIITGSGNINKTIDIFNASSINRVVDALLIEYKDGSKKLVQDFYTCTDNCHKKDKMLFKNFIKNYPDATQALLDFVYDKSKLNDNDIILLNDKFTFVKDVDLNKINFNAKDPFNDNSVIAYYPLKNDAKDYSGNGHHGVWHGKPQYQDGGAKFDGSNAIAIDFGKKLDCPFTYTGWFYVYRFNDKQVVLGIDYNGTPAGTEFDYHIVIQSNKIFLNVGAHDQENPTESTQIILDQYFFCAEFNLNQIKLSIIDSEGNLHQTTRNVSLTRTISTKVALGAWISDINNQGFYYYFHGSLKNVYIFNRALTNEEIQALHSNSYLFKKLNV